jgi:4-hydroxy-3-methylbut-2-en-1-yl diphosphate reductase
VARNAGVPAYLIDNTEDIQTDWLDGIRGIGLTAGASAPEGLVGRVVQYLNKLGYPRVETAGDIVENVEFSLPEELTNAIPEQKSRNEKSKRNFL